MGHSARRDNHNAPPRQPAEATLTTQLQQRYNKAGQSDYKQRKKEEKEGTHRYLQNIFYFHETCSFESVLI